MSESMQGMRSEGKPTPARGQLWSFAGDDPDVVRGIVSNPYAGDYAQMRRGAQPLVDHMTADPRWQCIGIDPAVGPDETGLYVTAWGTYANDEEMRAIQRALGEWRNHGAVAAVIPMGVSLARMPMPMPEATAAARAVCACPECKPSPPDPRAERERRRREIDGALEGRPFAIRCAVMAACERHEPDLPDLRRFILIELPVYGDALDRGMRPERARQEPWDEDQLIPWGWRAAGIAAYERARHL